jgi:hypothetical protein
LICLPDFFTISECAFCLDGGVCFFVDDGFVPMSVLNRPLTLYVDGVTYADGNILYADAICADGLTPTAAVYADCFFACADGSRWHLAYFL